METDMYSDITKSSKMVKQCFDSKKYSDGFFYFIESLSLEKILKIVKFKCKPNTAKPRSLCLEIGFWIF